MRPPIKNTIEAANPIKIKIVKAGDFQPTCCSQNISYRVYLDVRNMVIRSHKYLPINGNANTIILFFANSDTYADNTDSIPDNNPYLKPDRRKNNI